MSSRVSSTVPAAPASTIGGVDSKAPQQYSWKPMWRHLILFAYVHYTALHGFYLLFTGQVMFYTFLCSEYRYHPIRLV